MAQPECFFSEIHYENMGVDVNEGVEIVGPAGTNLDGWKLTIYDGAGHHKGDNVLRGLIPSTQGVLGVVYVKIALPNLSGGHALALIRKNGEISDFISWGGDITPKDGPAAGKKPFRIPVSESVFTSAYHSLQLTGRGSKASDFKWEAGKSQSFGKLNSGFQFVPVPKPAQPEEVHPGPGPSPVEPPPPVSVPAPPKPSPQVIQSVDLLVAKNRTAHHTDKLHAQDYFAVRRGQVFEIGLAAANPVTQALVKLTLYPETNQVQTIQVGASQAGNPETEWFAHFSGVEGGKSIVGISIPGRAVPGKYTISASGDDGKTWTTAVPIYILFNAWSKYDDVYLDNEADRNEYVLNEDGFIWVGSYFNFAPRTWSFAQFNTKSIECALSLLQRIPLQNRADIVLVSRNLSALVNSQDDQGVLVGNWSSNYAGGTSPSAWTGSADILKQYIQSGSPVKFGQCWVYSGVLTSVARALGIPARSVTNFASAHDTPDPTYNRAVDKYFLADGVTEDESKTSDSVWNFHVWNDFWFARRDLKDSNYTGWQAVDATPQERSDRKFQMGPVPVTAVKNGTKGVPYDLEFVYSEVNADEKYYVADGRGGYKLVRTITDSIGKNMSTKAVGNNNRNDVTLEYKYKENSPEERASHQAAQAGDLKAVLKVDITTKLGQTIHANLQLSSTKGGTFKVQFSAGIITYTGKPVATMEQSSVTVKVAAGATTSVPFELTAAKYVPSLKGTNGILFRAYCWSQETDDATIVQEEFDFVADDIAIKVVGPVKVGSESKAVVTFHNPLPIALTNLELTVEGTDLTKVQRFRYASVKAGETITQEVALYIWAAGKKVLTALLDSAEVNDLRGHTEVTTTN